MPRLTCLTGKLTKTADKDNDQRLLCHIAGMAVRLGRATDGTDRDIKIRFN